jgi:hypothetical protein
VSGGIVLAPLLPWPLLALPVAAALLLTGFVLVRRGRGGVWRAIALAGMVLALLNPSIVRERREPRPDVALIVVDRSLSQRLNGRDAEAAAGLSALKQAIDRFPDVAVRIVEAESGAREGKTRLISAMERAIAEEAAARLAAVFLLTDGQVHDVPAAAAPLPGMTAPVHVLLTGRDGERDRLLEIEQAPAYGLVGSTVTVSYHLADAGHQPSGQPPPRAEVRYRLNGAEAGAAEVDAGGSETLSFRLDHAGPTVLEIEADAVPGEVSPINNRAAVVVNGVRDRLRVLLVSGQPHPGERTWRNLLKSDPAVDLVHFTILRPPEKDDVTPLKELSLIVFPVQELFEEKLYDFDLIIFDRYLLRGILPTAYLERIGEYVRRGGALLAAVGPEFAGALSLYHTPLGAVMPAVPTGRIIERAFRPALTDLGRRHPVTAELPGERVAGDTGSGDEVDAPKWGNWLRLIEADARRGQTLLAGPDGRPLVVLDRVGDGRVAQLLSDHVWLWARGYDGGGPHGELLRRLAHWLMKEPELEEEGLRAAVAEGRLQIARQSLTPGDAAVTVTGPDGRQQELTLQDGGDGISRGTVQAEAAGLYRISDGTRTALAAAGRLNPPELADLRATAERLAPVAAATGGGVVWLADGLPELRRVAPGRDAAGRGWLGLGRNQGYAVAGVSETPLVPALFVLLLAFGGLVAAWWREGR